MKRLELTPEQRIKFTTMCIKLFPEYTSWGWSSYMAQAIEFKEINTNNWEAIQWFEFCMTHLAKKLTTMDDFTKYQTTGNFMYVHPIDYLFEKYKSTLK